MTRARPFFRFAAVLLCFQPVFFHSSVALAANLDSFSLTSDSFADQPMPAQFEAGSLSTRPPATEAGPLSPQRALQPQAGQLGVEALSKTLPPVDEPVDAATYVCGPGDVLELNFWGLQNLKLRVTVDLEGRAFVPKVGYFDLRGKVLADARRTIRAAMSSLYPRLNFDVALAEPRTFQVQVAGAVVHPASYPARATERVAALIARAGGLGPNASHRRIAVRHRDGIVESADLLRFELTGDNQFNPHVLDGDAVQVGFEELGTTISGGVNRPGRYELIGTRDLTELVELAGGLAPDATTELPVSIVRWMEGVREEQVAVSFEAAGRLPQSKLQKEDRVRIATTEELKKSVYVFGAVAGATREKATTGPGAAVETRAPDEASSTRRVPYVSGETVRTLLVRLGGVGPLADLRRSYIVREAGPVVPVDLEKLIVLRDLSADREVLLGDTLVIPFKRSSILVEGSVFAPGAYPYNPTYGIDQYLALAGGPSRNAQDITKMHVVTPTGEMKSYKKDLLVEPGSSLVVPERNFSRAEVVTIALGIASVIVSGVAVMISASK